MQLSLWAGAGRRGLGFAALAACGLSFGSAQAETVTAAEEAPEFVFEDVAAYDGPIEGDADEYAWPSDDGVVGKELPGWEDWIAWSGAPIDDGMFYTTGDWVKRGTDEVAPVPLPGAGLLLLGGLAGLAALRRRF